MADREAPARRFGAILGVAQAKSPKRHALGARLAALGDPAAALPNVTAAPDVPLVGSYSASRRRLAMNVAAGGAVNAIKIGVQLVMLPVMAHLLGPAEFGLYALALPTVSFFLALADGGLGTSLARETGDSPVVWSTAFWVLLLSGITLALVVSGWGVVLSELSHEPRLKGIMGFLSISFVLVTVSILPSARLTRQGRLTIFSAADLGSTLIGVAVAVSLASRGAGAWSLAAQYVVGLFVRALVLNSIAFFRPTADFQLSALRDHISTGSSVLGTRLADFSGRLLENLFYGRTFGAAALGTYTFANQAPRFICEAASGPIWAALYAHALREDRRTVAALHVKLVHLLGAAVFPVAFLLAASAPELLNIILGPRWASAAELLRILVPVYALHVLSAQSGAVLIANGRSWELFWLTLLLTVGRVAAVFAGFWVGPIAVAYLIGGSHIVYALLMFHAPGRTNGSSPLQFLRVVASPALAGALAGLACFWMIHLQAATLVWIIASIASGALLYLTILALLDGRLLLRELQAVQRIVFAGRTY